MSTTLKTQLSALAATFADRVLAAIRSASIQELVAEATGSPARRAPRAPVVTTKGRATPTRPAARPPVVRSNGSPSTATLKTAPAATPKKPTGPLARRTPEMVAKTLDRVAALVKTSAGLRSEEIRERLGLDRREMPRVLGMGLETKVLWSKGVKRSTTYWWNAASQGPPSRGK